MTAFFLSEFAMSVPLKSNFAKRTIFFFDKLNKYRLPDGQ
ncbi:hypothetical protein [Klebsiella pneumoniae IS53]|nr:hypothetical protein [Klebsiella pneumoniae IS53]